MGVETYCVIPRLFGLGPSMVRAVEWEQKDRDVPENRGRVIFGILQEAVRTM